MGRRGKLPPASAGGCARATAACGPRVAV